MRNYVEVERSYCHFLAERQNTIRKCCFSKETNIADCRKLICGIAKPAKWTAKKVEFYGNVNHIRSKKQLYYYVKNSINKALDTLVEA